MTLPALDPRTVPARPSRSAAQHAARVELSKIGYHREDKPLLLRLWTWVLDRLASLIDDAASHVPGGPWGLVALVLAALAVLAVVWWRTGAPGLAHRRHDRVAVVGEAGTDAAGHRRLAAQALRRGDLATAVTERFRAVVRELEERGVVEAAIGRTATEVVAAAAPALPALAGPLTAAAACFDRTVYGHLSPTKADVDLLTRLDEQVVSVRGTAVQA